MNGSLPRSFLSWVVTLILLPILAIGVMPEPATGASKLADSIQQLLGQINAASLAGAPTDLSGLSTGLLRVSASGKIELVFHSAGAVGEAEVADLVSLGAEIMAKLAWPGLIQAWVPYGQVEAAAALPWVVAVTPPDYGETNPHPNNPINSQGVPLHNADLAQAQGITGAGVRVGVISNGVANLAASQAQSELPAVTVLAAGSGDEGTAMLEIVHDMAPGAALVFHATGGGTAGHVTAVQNLVANGVNVIAEDLAFDAEPAFQQGVVAMAREVAVTAGVSVHSSSGNRGQNHAARVQAIGTGSGPDGNAGPFTGCPYAPLNVVAIAPGGDTTFDVVLGGSSRFTLQWSEPRAIFPTAGAGGFTNLDLFIMDAAGTTCLATSTGAQSFGSGDTIEQIVTPAALAGTPAKIVVNVFGSFGAVAPPILDLRWRGTQSETDTPTRAGSNDPDKNYTGRAFAIGAVNAGSGTLEGFSSAGPVNLVLTTVCPGGVYPCPAGGVAGPPAQQFQGLDFLGADGVSVSGVGGFGSPFFGTSAAAPHTAGCDALVRDLIGAAAPPATVRARLASTAVDFGPPGEDSTNGAGLVDCFAALLPPKALCQNRTVSTDPGVCSASNVSINNGSFDPDGGPVALAQSPAGPYGLGATPVTLTVTDLDSLFDTCQATVTVVDTTPPTISCPAPITVECTSPSGATASFSATATDNCGAVTPSCSPPSGSTFPLGNTTVSCTATDGSGNSASCTTPVNVVDTTPPIIASVTPSPNSLWPPNHEMVPVSVAVAVSDICDAAPSCHIISVSSNEPVNGLGDGNTAPDWQITGALTVNLRAERSGEGNGRVYTIAVQCTDASGNNSATQTAAVTVPHNK